MLHLKSGMKNLITTKVTSGRSDVSSMKWLCWNPLSEQILLTSFSKKSWSASMRRSAIPTQKSCPPLWPSWWLTVRRKGLRLRKYSAIRRWWTWNPTMRPMSKVTMLCLKQSNFLQILRIWINICQRQNTNPNAKQRSWYPNPMRILKSANQQSNYLFLHWNKSLLRKILSYLLAKSTLESMEP